MHARHRRWIRLTIRRVLPTLASSAFVMSFRRELTTRCSMEPL